MAHTPQDHARFSPSGAEKWMNCPGSLALEASAPEELSSIYGDEGTAAHELAAWVLTHKRDSAWFYEGHKIRIVNGKYKSPSDILTLKEVIKTDRSFEIDQAMIEYVNEYVDNIRIYEGLPGAIALYEHRVDFSDIIGVPGQFGTSDAIIITPNELIICDLKYGMGVPVSAEKNKQLMIYALGALSTAELFYDVSRVRLVIHQPRIENLSEWDLSVGELRAFGKDVAIAAQVAKGAINFAEKNPIEFYGDFLEKFIKTYLNPGEKQCRWCKVKATCPALQRRIEEEVLSDFMDVTEVHKSEDDVLAANYEHASDVVRRTESETIARHMKCVPLIEMWCKAVREAAFQRLSHGETVPGYKLVEGRKGHRAWVNKEMVEELIGDNEDVWKKEIKTPAQVEKLYKKDKAFWKDELLPLITRPPGKPSVTPEDGKRPALILDDASLDFSDITGDEFDE